MMNKLSADRKTLMADLELRLRKLDERLNRDTDAVQELIAQNARVEQNQEEYNARYDAAVSRYEATKAEIRQYGIRKREFAGSLMPWRSCRKP